MIYDPRNHYWIVAGDVDRPYSSAVADFVQETSEDYAAWKAEGRIATPIASIAELVDVLTAAGIAPGAELGGRWPVLTYTIVRRLEDEGLSSAALAALDSNPVARIRFLTTAWVWSDDPTANAMITAIGADPAEILAFDPNWRA